MSFNGDQLNPPMHNRASVFDLEPGVEIKIRRIDYTREVLPQFARVVEKPSFSPIGEGVVGLEYLMLADGCGTRIEREVVNLADIGVTPISCQPGRAIEWSPHFFTQLLKE